ncbi:MAG: DUF2922 domain-containing protein [Selenomonadaceae bacterium]|nr:DUF2922 domain-containing protein [Selenomonadaceae bacterium]
MKSVLKMILTLSDGKSVTYSLADPKAGLTGAEVETALQEMIAKDAVIVGTASAVAVKDAYIQDTDRRELA